MKRYDCVAGYVIGEAGEYEIGEEVPGIGEVQGISEEEEDEEEVGK